jgi:uncharacterized membrane protein
VLNNYKLSNEGVGMGAVIVHITAGSVALVSGYAALYAAKGASIHRRIGMVFVYSMLTMCTMGGILAIAHNAAPSINLPAALITGSMVITGLTTVRPVSSVTRGLDLFATLVTLSVGLVNITYAVQAFANGGTRDGIPAFPFVLFGTAGILATIGDVRIMRSGPLRGTRRVARHLWRMSFALLVAALSFFIGQAKVIPKPIRIMPLLAMPLLAVIVTMFYWMWRVRVRHSLRNLTQTHTA